MRYEPLPWALSGVDFAGSIQRMVVVEVDTPHGLARADVHAAGRPRAALVLGHGAAGGVGAVDLVAARDAALEERVSVALVEQPYRVAGRRSPAPARQLDRRVDHDRRAPACARVASPTVPRRRALVGRTGCLPHGGVDRSGRRRLPRLPAAAAGPFGREPTAGARSRRAPDPRRPREARPIRHAAAGAVAHCRLGAWGPWLESRCAGRPGGGA